MDNPMNHEQGFTLIETVVSLAVLGVMMALVTGIFASAAAKTSAGLAAGVERERLVASFASAAATGHIPEGLERQSGEVTIDFDGKTIRADGEYLTGVYGENRIIMKCFLPR